MEICYVIAVNKADGDNAIRTKAAKDEFKMIIDYLRPATEVWKSQVLTLFSPLK